MKIYKIMIAFIPAIIFTLLFNLATFGQRQAQQPVRQTSSNIDQRLSRQTASLLAAKKVQWHNNLYSAYSQALRENKPLVAYFYFYDCGFCKKLENGPLSSKEINSLADKAVFVRVNIHMDDAQKNVSKLIQQLQLERYPSVAVMNVYKDKLTERGRIIGLFETSEYYFNLTQILL